MFIPYALARDSNSFFQSDELDNRLLFERKRILDNITDTTFFDNLDSKQLIDCCIEFEEDTV